MRFPLDERGQLQCYGERAVMGMCTGATGVQRRARLNVPLAGRQAGPRKTTGAGSNGKGEWSGAG